MKNLFGGVIEFDDDEKMEDVINRLTVKFSVVLIEQAITYALKSGAFDLEEAYILYKCLSKIKGNETKIES